MSENTEYNGIYYLDPNNKVLVNLSPEEREIHQFVWNHTKFIPTQQVLDFVSLAIDDFLTKVKDSPTKIVMEKLTSLSPGSYNIIIIDDAVYSGNTYRRMDLTLLFKLILKFKKYTR